MNLSELSRLRLLRQQVETSSSGSVRELMGRMGAMQAQDYAMSKWAVGCRVPGSKIEEVESALNSGEILRTHLLRPTWHLVSSNDIHWLLELTAPRIKSQLKTRNRQLELSAEILNKSNDLIVNSLEGGKSFNRDELVSLFENAGIKTDLNRASHLLMHAEMEGILCSGPEKNRKITYALLSERVSHKPGFNREEALQKLATVYFTSRGPASLRDFAWWSGLTGRDAAAALQMAKPKLTSLAFGTETYWFSGTIPENTKQSDQVFLLPAFDEFLLSYTDRKASVPALNFRKAVYSNGIFRPLIILGGQVVGIWKRNLKKDQILIETSFFTSKSELIPEKLEDAAQLFAGFLGKQAEVLM